VTSFKDLGLSPDIQLAIDELGFSQPSPIQEEGIPPLLAGHDVIGQAQTGTGKTAAFGLPMLQYLDPANDEVQAIVLTPTRELCIQVTQALRSYAEHLDIEIVAVFGGAPIKSQQAQLRSGAHVVVATVGRMKDLISRRSLVLTAARFVVLDEADEMLDLGFLEDVEKILRMCPSGRQTALFSATMPPPIQKLADAFMYDPIVISITPETLTVDKISQAYVEVSNRDKTEKLIEVLKAEEPEQAILFCRTKIGATRLERDLKNRGLDVKALHGDLSQGTRDGVMIAFKGHRVKLLVATDIAARGLDVDHVTHIINYDLPNSSETYVHRIGRTGRAGRTGRSITFVTPDQRKDLEQIKKDVKTSISAWETPEERIEHAPEPRRRRRRGEEATKIEEEKPAEEAVANEPEELQLYADADTEGAPEILHENETDAGDDDVADGREESEKDADDSGDDGVPELGEGQVKLFVNRGKRSGIEEEDLRWALREGAVLSDDAISDVRVLDRFSFVELDADKAERTVEFLDGTKLKGAEIRVEVARK